MHRYRGAGGAALRHRQYRNPAGAFAQGGSPGRGEMAIVQTHTTIGAKLLGDLHVGSDYNDFVRMAVDIAHYHHENWDGTGYPEGLKGESIPPGGPDRIHCPGLLCPDRQEELQQGRGLSNHGGGSRGKVQSRYFQNMPQDSASAALGGSDHNKA